MSEHATAKEAAKGEWAGRLTPRPSPPDTHSYPPTHPPPPANTHTLASPHLRLAQLAENHHLVHAVEQLGAEVGLKLLKHKAAGRQAGGGGGRRDGGRVGLGTGTPCARGRRSLGWRQAPTVRRVPSTHSRAACRASAQAHTARATRPCLTCARGCTGCLPRCRRWAAGSRRCCRPWR